MTTGPQPNNATPQPLRLAAPNVPRMPFSSPMGEEVLSPTSPNASRSPPQHQIKLSQNQGGQEKYDNSKWLLPSQRPDIGVRSQSHENTRGKPKWPGLNVVTNLSKAPSLAQRAVDGSARQNAGLGLKKKEGGSVATSRKASVETLGLGHQPSGKSLRSLGSKGRLGDLKRASSKWSNLSPSDRAVVIGISISAEELAQQSASPGESPTKLGGLTEQHALNRQPSVAPNIVVTPAKETAPWSDEVDNSSQPQRQRAASSVYSQAPPPTEGRVIDSSMVPPIPPLPPEAQKENAQNGVKKIKKQPPPRIMSNYTEIDEAESPDLHEQDRPGTGESRLKILTKSSSMDTIATRHRSRGWWNEIISPFFPKSPMTFKAYTPPKQPTQDAPRPLEQDRSLQEARQTFPPPPESDGLKSGHTSWTDSTMDPEYEKRLELDGFHDRSTMIVDEPQEDPVRDSSLLPSRFEGFGQAAEYYEACLYDMHSTTPYFECQNHTCVQPRLGSAEVPVAGKDGNNGLRGVGDSAAEVPTEKPRQIEHPQALIIPMAMQQAPTNRFSAAFHEAIEPASKERPTSHGTLIEDLDATPDVQEAHAAPIVRAPAPVPASQPPIPENEPAARPELKHPSEPEQLPPLAESTPQQRTTPAPAYSPPRGERPPKRYVAVMPPNRESQSRNEQPLSPEPLSPAQQRRISRGAIPLTDVNKGTTGDHPRSPTLNTIRYREHSEREQTTVADLYPPPREPSKGPRSWEIKEKDDLPPREPKVHKPLTMPRCRNCFSGAKPKSKKKKWIMIAIVAALVLLIILVLVLTMTLTRKGHKRPIQSSWLNITGFPPIPTGVSTIVQPNAVVENPDCVQPVTMWSCALPKEEQAGIKPNAPNQPNFRVEVMFQNGTNATSNTTPSNDSSGISRRSYVHVANAVSAGSFVRNHLLRVRSAFSGSHFSPSPAPPSWEDQTFLGNTSDRITDPLDGEYTPFFMSFESAKKLSPRLVKRQSSESENVTDQFPDVTKAIPPPNSNPDGTAAAANLHPYPSSQPLRLYDRGLDTEHYGFYTYFDRSIFLKSAAPLNASSNDSTPVPDDEDGGSDINAASVRCTWAQTRFLVQIWTKKGNSATLLQSSANTTSKSSHPSSPNSTDVTSSSANDFTQPGSFPYPVTITLDRHGGDIAKKMIYCYGMDERQRINSTEKQYQLEDRGVGGQLVNPALGPFGDVNVTTAQGGPGGIDGGTGGCLCKWQNFDTGL